MTKTDKIDKHNRKVLEQMLEDDPVKKKKQESIVAKKTPVNNEKKGTDEIRKAYFKSWYDSCKDIYNKERRRKRKTDKKGR